MKKGSKIRYIAPVLSVIDYMTEIGYAASGETEMAGAEVEFESVGLSFP